MNDPTFHNAYPTPMLVWKRDGFEDVNRTLADEILKKEAAAAQSGAIRRDGWTMQEDILSWPMAEVRSLQQHLQDCAAWLTKRSARIKMEQAQLRLATSINVRREGQYSQVAEQRYEASWSGLHVLRYEVPSGEDDTAGRVGFLDPRTAPTGGYVPGDPFDYSQIITMETGLTLLFPPWLKYLIYPLPADSLAVLVFFDVYFRPASAADQAEGQA